MKWNILISGIGFFGLSFSGLYLLENMDYSPLMKTIAVCATAVGFFAGGYIVGYLEPERKVKK